jgi:hypothetical protein
VWRQQQTESARGPHGDDQCNGESVSDISLALQTPSLLEELEMCSAVGSVKISVPNNNYVLRASTLKTEILHSAFPQPVQNRDETAVSVASRTLYKIEMKPALLNLSKSQTNVV